ncbi:hypothetical protein P7E07_03765 [Enterococcus gallinarum]|uniref:hypothetical protein n=1 Tax=Enterococcus gallinarum TaxID=1353 RepID=UPI0028909DB6|nr:hypothetical protein [Enterococcus gallinarum]MDT2693070.1 hypothetical protein [Enterococcus gallinarum]
MSNYRWRAFIESKYKQARKEKGYFDRKLIKKIYRIWIRSKRLGLTEDSLYMFTEKIVLRINRGEYPKELNMNIGKLEQHLKKIAKDRS